MKGCKKWYAYHTIYALSRFCETILPKPVSNCNFYTDIISNIFKNKDSTDVVRIEVFYNVSNKIVKVTPKYGQNVKDIIDVEEFIQWFQNNRGIKFSRKTYKINKNTKIVYNYNDNYTCYSILICESHKNNYKKNYITIKELKR